MQKLRKRYVHGCSQCANHTIEKGKIIYNRNLGEIKGVQLTPKQAGLEAYKEAVRQVEVRLYANYKKHFTNNETT